ncbi:MAG: AraC family transcriptional regulator [Opitutae bacterium]|nr:AraC family transcriptional regulator [Opitutae bacterium]
MKIRVLSVDLGVRRGKDHFIDKAKGQKCYTLYVFKTAALAKTSIGLNEVNAGDCLLVSPSSPHYLKSKDDEWEYDSISFKGSDATRLVSQAGLDCDTVHTPLQTYFIDALLDKIVKEFRAMDMLYERVISSTLDELLTKVVRFSKQDFVLSMPDHSQRLRDLRSEVHENFAKAWTIGQMANMMGLSASRFASLYKQEFEASPTEDLIRTRIVQAQKMLSATKVSVKQVSLACGFESVHYFHRAFKRRLNITPKHYQNHKLAMRGSVPLEEKSFTLDRLSVDSDFSGTMEIVDGEILFHGTGSPWADYLGFSVDEVKSKPFLNFVYPDDLDIARETVSNIVEGRNVKDVTVRLNTKAGDFVKIDFSALIKGNTWFWFARKLLIDEEIN